MQSALSRSTPSLAPAASITTSPINRQRASRRLDRETRIYGGDFYLRAQGFDQVLVRPLGATTRPNSTTRPATTSSSRRTVGNREDGQQLPADQRFHQVQVTPLPVDDTAWLYDSPGNDTFQAGPESSTLRDRLSSRNAPLQQVHAIACRRQRHG